MAVTLGPRVAGIAVMPMPILIVLAIGLSVGVSLLASFLPASSAARLDPCATFQEV